MSYQIDREKCVCCHNCAMECPASAIRYKGTKYWIDSELCVSCGHCAQVCHISAITDPERPEPTPEPHGLRVLEADLAVLGAGAAGLIAAVRTAMETGKKVVVLEKAQKPGGNTNFAHGFMVSNSRWQQEAGLPDTREEEVRMAMERCTWRLDTAIIKRAIYSTGPFFDWLCSFGGAEEGFALVEKVWFDGQKKLVLEYPRRRLANLKCRDQAIGPGWAGTYVVRKLLEQCEALGIPVLTRHRAVRLLTGPDGAVNGVVADNPGGQTQVNCKACLVATGGFGRSDEKLKRYIPEFFEGETPIHRFSVPTNTGDGMDLGEQVGADIPPEYLCVNMFGPAHHPFSYCIYRLMLQPEAVYVNLNGRRFIDENAGLMGARYAIRKQPKELAWCIMSQKTLETTAKRLMENPPDGNDGWIFKDWEREVEEELKLDTPAKRADTLAGLAAQIGVDPETLTREIERYNRFCALGRDLDFCKDPRGLMPLEEGPYYAFYGQRFSEGAFGGLKVNANTQVLDKQGAPIPGLYAAGDAASANLQRDMLGVISELTWAVSSGYIAGEELSKELDH